ncbi:MAG: HAMP domain-containing protein [Delftia acidovorans]|uniref:ATP-binding protein n=1 Tax=Delftia sp. UME58 TaxID=1862322 RepID=UPI001601AE2C|nr:ATP-binding protein [Delftia sp. UME58]MBB1652758.1 two-component sensor histidine kinase [Delftia sp. UME58]MBL8356048.1 HAMP domain-containing protein [Delftia acidovorans]
MAWAQTGALLQRLWPQTLSGRVALILVAGMLAAQALTGTIWWESRRGQLLEVPLRLLGARAADSLLLLSSLPPEARAAAVGALSTQGYQLTLIDAARARPLMEDKASDPADAADAMASDLLADVLARRVGAAVPFHLLALELHGGAETLLTAHEPEAHVRMLLGLGNGQWLQVQAVEGEAGYPVRPYRALADYVLRIYLLRIVVVVVVALLAVRLAMRPLARMASAADALGKDLQSPPLPLDGPREVRQAAQAFNVMQQRIADGVAERTRFFAAVSHDLRTPITRLRLRSEMLEPASLRDKFRRDLQEMEAMVTATLDMLTGADARGERQALDINALVQGVAQDLGEAHGVHIPITGRALRPLDCYPHSLRRCLQNLLENALRYGRDAELHISDSDDLLRIAVLDRGPGIAQEQLAQVLEPFYRMEASRNAGSGGFGLGLSIADAVAKAHGGRIVLGNREGGGLEAVLELPRKTPAR